MPDKFTPRQEKAIQCHLSGLTHVDAYRAAYSTDNMKPETARRKAHTLFTLPKVKARVEKEKRLALQRNHTTLDKVLSLMKDAMEVDPNDIFDDEGQMLPLKDIPKDTRLAMTGFEVNETTGGMFKPDVKVTKIKFASKEKIYEMFMKHFGAFAAEKFQVEDVTPISKRITAEEAAAIDKKLENDY